MLEIQEDLQMGKTTRLLSLGIILMASSAFAGTYTTISIDGSFADWVDVPLVVSDPADASGVDYGDIKVANDDDHIYVYIKLHTAADPFTVTSHYFIDGDGAVATGFQVFGGNFWLGNADSRPKRLPGSRWRF